MSSLPQPLPPVPVQPIYGVPVAQRPGIITLIGVLSIVIGSLGLLFNGIAGLQGMLMLAISKASQTAVAARQAASVAAQQAPAGPVDPQSMPVADRATVLRGLAMHRPITKPRRAQLDALLARCGREIFKLRGTDLTVEVVRQNVNDSGRLPDAKGGEGPDFFIVGEGRIELDDDHAKFVPGDGRETVRVDANDTAEQPNWRAGLTPAQVKAIVDTVEQQAGQPLTPATRSKLQAVFASPVQGFFDPVPTIPEASAQVQSVNYLTNAAGGGGGAQLTVTTPKGMISLDGQGNVQSSTTWGGAGAFAAAGGPAWNLDVRAAAVALACAAASLLLAVYLLVIGIFMLRQHPRAGRLHRIYAWVKLPVAIAGGIAWAAFWLSAARGTGAMTWSPTVVTIAAVMVMAGCAYPIVVLIALRTRSAREYFSTVT